MDQLTVFNNDLFGEVRFVKVEGKEYAVASDVAKALGYVKTRNAINAHCKGVVKHKIPTNGGEQEVKLIPEEDICRLIQKSKLLTEEEKKALVDSLGLTEKFILEERDEIRFFSLIKPTIEDLFECKTETQMQVGSYKVDMYIEDLNLVIEYDENNHSGYCKDKEKEREQFLKLELGGACTILRLDNRLSEGELIKVVLDTVLAISYKRSGRYFARMKL